MCEQLQILCSRKHGSGMQAIAVGRGFRKIISRIAHLERNDTPRARHESRRRVRWLLIATRGFAMLCWKLNSTAFQLFWVSSELNHQSAQKASEVHRYSSKIHVSYERRYNDDGDIPALIREAPPVAVGSAAGRPG